MKNMKYVFILAVMLMIISVGGISASSDISDISSDNVASIAVDHAPVNAIDESSAIAVSDAKSVSAYGDSDESVTYEITDDNYADYFVTDDESEEGDRNGTIRDDAPIKSGDTLKLTNLTGKVFNINKALTITSSSPDNVLTNCMIKLFAGADNSIVSGLNITVDNADKNYTGADNLPLWPIIAIQVSNVTIKNNYIYNNATNGHALGLGDVSDSVIDNNTLISASHPFYLLGNNNLISHNYINSKTVPGVGGFPYVFYITRVIGHSMATWYKNTDNGTINNNIIEYNTIDGTDSGWLVYGAGLLANSTSGNVFRYNNLINGQHAFQVQNGINYKVYGNNITHVATAINAATNTVDWEVFNNYIEANSTGILVDFADKVYNNTIIVNSTGKATGIKFNNNNLNGTLISGNNIIVRGSSVNGIDMSAITKSIDSMLIEGNTIDVSSINASAVGINAAKTWSASNAKYNYTNLNINDNKITVKSDLSSADTKGMDLAAINFSSISGNKINVENGVGINVFSYNITDKLNPLVNVNISSNEINAKCGIKVGNASSKRLISDMNISDNGIIAENGILLGDGGNLSGISIESNEIVVLANNTEGFAIFANNMDKLTLNNNAILFYGITEGNLKQYAINLDGINNLKITDNKVTAKLPSQDISYDPMTYAPTYYGLNLFIANSNNIDVLNNMFNTTATEETATSNYATLCNIYLNNVTNCGLIANNITTKGTKYAYGIVASGVYEMDEEGEITYYPSDLLLEANNIATVCTGYYANGIELDGPISADLYNNKISANAVGVSYPVYSASFNGPSDVVFDSNKITGNANSVYGIEVYGGNIVNIIKNNIAITGNFTLGIATSANQNFIIGNNISAKGAGLGTPTGGDAFPSQNLGIFANQYAKNVMAYDNYITTTGNHTIDSSAATSTRVYNNYLVANKDIGDDSVSGDSPYYLVSDNTPLTATITASNVVKYYGNSTKLVATLKNNKGDLIVGKEVIVTIGKTNYKATTNAKGQISLALNQAAGTYSATIKFADPNYVTATKKVSIKVVKPTMKAVSSKVKRGKYLQVLFKDANGKVIKGQKVTLKLSGKTYTVTTNAKGIASLKLTVKVGTYKIVAGFKNTNPYGKTTQTIAVKVVN